MAISAKYRSNFAVLHRKWWHLELNKNISGTLNSNNQNQKKSEIAFFSISIVFKILSIKLGKYTALPHLKASDRIFKYVKDMNPVSKHAIFSYSNHNRFRLMKLQNQTEIPRVVLCKTLFQEI